MSKRSTTVAVTLLVASLLLLSVFAPTLVSARPANQIPVASMPEAGDALADPAADAWGEVDPVEVPMASAPSGVPDASDTSAEAVTVEAAYTDTTMFVRVSWDDATADETITSPQSFVDGAAVQVPTNASTQPAIALGSKRSNVNVWYWNAQSGAQEILAGGPGTTTAFPEPTVETNARRTDGGWQVVFARPLTTDAANRSQFTMEQDMDVAFAVWNGSNMERSGRHAVSEWHTFPFGPDEQPPFQSILWTIAGVAIGVVVLVTAVAVRKARDER